MERSAAGPGGLFYHCFNGSSENGQQACAGTEVRGVRAVALGRGCVQSVYCTTNVLPLRNFDTVRKDLYCQRIVGDFLSIRIQLCRGWVARRSHLLCSFPCLRSSVHLRAREKWYSRVTRGWQTGQHVSNPLMIHEPVIPHHTVGEKHT